MMHANESARDAAGSHRD
ncbi:hypothetical protein MP638_003719 [Amoeboaphelidium occidentale]|nr:hypothetical protein MP638_003719 [Amoeboaphelidium occidentale]